MPNWCSCELEIEGDINDIQKLLDDAKSPNEDEHKHTDFSLENFIPTPEEIQDRDVNSWRMDHWGTKWDIQPEVDNQGEFVSLKFDSAWSPPIEALNIISKLYPSLSFKLTFSEEAMDFFGICLYKNGLKNELKTSYSERFYFDLQSDYLQAKIEENNIVIPLIMAYFDNPYEMDGKEIKVNCFLTLPANIIEDNIQRGFGDSILITSEKDIIEKLSSKKFEITDFIKENLQQIKTAAAHNNLNSELPINKQINSKKRKI